MMARDLDDTDQALIRLLEADARQTNVALARAVGRTEGAVRRRLERMFSQGLIRIVAIPGGTLWAHRVHAVFGLQVAADKLNEVSRELTRMPELRFVYETTGRHNIMAVGFFADESELRHYLGDQLGAITGVLGIETHQILATPKREFSMGLRPAREAPSPA